MHTFKRSAMFALAAVLVMAGCAGEDGKDGAAGANFNPAQADAQCRTDIRP